MLNGPPGLVSFPHFWCLKAQKSGSNPRSFLFSAAVPVPPAVLSPGQTVFPVSHCQSADSGIVPGYLRPVSGCWNPPRKSLRTLGCRSLPLLSPRLTMCTDFAAHTAAASARSRKACSRALLYNSTAGFPLPISPTVSVRPSAPKILSSSSVPATIRPSDRIGLSAYSSPYFITLRSFLHSLCAVLP